MSKPVNALFQSLTLSNEGRPPSQPNRLLSESSFINDPSQTAQQVTRPVNSRQITLPPSAPLTQSSLQPLDASLIRSALPQALPLIQSSTTTPQPLRPSGLTTSSTSNLNPPYAASQPQNPRFNRTGSSTNVQVQPPLDFQGRLSSIWDSTFKENKSSPLTVSSQSTPSISKTQEQKQIEELKQQLEQLQINYSKMQQRIHNYTVDNHHLQASKEALKNECAQLNKQIYKLEKELQLQYNQADSQTEPNPFYPLHKSILGETQESQQLAQLQQALREQKSDFEDEKAESEQQLKLLETTIQHLQERLEASNQSLEITIDEKKTLENTLGVISAQIAQSNQKTMEFARNSQKLEEENQELRKGMESSSLTLHQEREAIIQELNAKKEELVKAQEEKEELRGQLDELKTQLKTLTENFEDKFNSLQDSNKDLVEQREFLKETFENLQQSLEQTKHASELQVKELEEEHHKKMGELKELRQRLNQVEIENKSLVKEGEKIPELENKIATLKQQLEETQKKLEELNSILNSSEAEKIQLLTTNLKKAETATERWETYAKQLEAERTAGFMNTLENSNFNASAMINFTDSFLAKPNAYKKLDNLFNNATKIYAKIENELENMPETVPGQEARIQELAAAAIEQINGRSYYWEEETQEKKDLEALLVLTDLILKDEYDFPAIRSKIAQLSATVAEWAEPQYIEMTSLKNFFKSLLDNPAEAFSNQELEQQITRQLQLDDLSEMKKKYLNAIKETFKDVQSISKSELWGYLKPLHYHLTKSLNYLDNKRTTLAENEKAKQLFNLIGQELSAIANQ